MSKLYLIRRNMESFAGPLTLVEMKEAYKRMTFGLQDEVSGHCGPWVTFDDLLKIKKHYPEVAKIVHEDMLAGWGVSDHSTKKVTTGANDEARRTPSPAGQKHLKLALVFLLVAVIAFAAAVFMAVPSHVTSKGKDDGEQPVANPDDAQAMIDAGNTEALRQYILQNQTTIVGQVTKSKKSMNDWLPYLRMQAFAVTGANGEIVGISPKILRGAASGAAPVDCSEKMWRRRFRSNSKLWSAVSGGKGLVRMHWARLLAWDPHWIQRRESKGWIAPKNYYVGCLSMVDRSLATIALESAATTVSGNAVSGAVSSQVAGLTDADKGSLDRMRQRVQWLLEMTRDGHSIVSPTVKSDDVLSQWTCFEAADDLKSLNHCRDGAAAPVGDDWASYTEERFNWNVLRLALAQRKALPPDLAQLMSVVAPKLSKADFLTGFDYRAEQKLAKLLSQLPADRSTDKSIDKLGNEFPDVKLAH